MIIVTGIITNKKFMFNQIYIAIIFFIIKQVLKLVTLQFSMLYFIISFV